MSAPHRSAALQEDAPLWAAKFLAGKSLRVSQPGKKPVSHHSFFEKFPAVIYFKNLKKKSTAKV